MKKKTALVLAMLFFFMMIPASCTRTDGQGNHVDKNGYSVGLITEDIDEVSCVLTGYKGNDKTLFIPDEIDGKTIVAFATTEQNGKVVGTFENNRTLEYVNIPSGVHSIERRTFSGCSALNAALIPATVVSIGEDAFSGCSALKEIEFESVNPVGLCYNWNPDAIRVNLGSRQSLVAVATGIAQQLVFSQVATFVSKPADKLGDLALNNLLGACGGENAEMRFQRETSEKLDDIDKQLDEIRTQMNEKLDKMAEDIKTLSEQTESIRYDLNAMEKNILSSSDKAQLGSRMTTINQYIVKIDTLYEDYGLIIQERNPEKAKIKTEKFIKKLERYDLAMMVNYINSELTNEAAGSQTPLLTLYYEYLTKTNPFKHQYIGQLYMFANYMQGEVVKGVQLYTEYCNYMQVLDTQSPAEKEVWQEECEHVLNACRKSFKKQETLLPSTDNAALNVKCPEFDRWHVDEPVTPEKGFCLANHEYDFELCFSSDEIPMEQVASWYEPYDRYFFCPYTGVTRKNVTVETYKKLKEIRDRYDPEATILEFINKNAGTNIKSEYWGCYWGKGAEFDDASATIDIGDLNKGKIWTNYNGGDGAYYVCTW